MTLSIRSFLLAAALPVAGLSITAAPVAAQAPVAKQTAELAQPAKSAKIVGKGVVWRCAGTSCVAPEGASRAAISCAALVKQAGKVTAFALNGVALDEAALARCNSFARS